MTFPIDQYKAREIYLRDFNRKASFERLAWWLDEYTEETELAEFIRSLGRNPNWIKEYKVKCQLFVKLAHIYSMLRSFQSQQKASATTVEHVFFSSQIWQLLMKEVNSTRTFIIKAKAYLRGMPRNANGGDF